MRFRRIDGPVGARVDAVDLARPLSGGEIYGLLQGLREHQVLLMRDQELEEERLLEIAAWFGPQYRPPDEIPVAASDGVPGVLRLSSDGGGVGGVAPLAAHTDLHYMPVPTLGAVLYAVEVPPSGGETSWSDQYRAWDRLVPDLRERCRGLRAATPNPFAGRSARPDLTGPHQQIVGRDVPLFPHPVGRTHPETGRTSLYVTAYTEHLVAPVGRCLSPGEEADLLGRLHEHLDDASVWTTHQWRAGDLVIWDNRCTLHRRAAFDPSQRRTMLRAQMAGSIPF